MGRKFLGGKWMGFDFEIQIPLQHKLPTLSLYDHQQKIEGRHPILEEGQERKGDFDLGPSSTIFV